MIWLLRNFSIRLWIAAAAGIPLSFVVLPFLDKFSQGLNPLCAATAIILIIFFLAGYCMNLAGEKRVKGLIREAETWTRAGIYNKGEQCYIKAVRIYDSFLFAPWQAKKITEKLTGSLARFSMASPGRDLCFDRAVTVFLGKAPHEEEIALLWLKRLCDIENPDSMDHELLTRMAAVDFKNPEITALLAEIFIELNSSDFAARKVYQKVLDDSLGNSKTRASITEIIGKKNNEITACPDFSKKIKPGFSKKSTKREMLLRLTKKSISMLSAFFTTFSKIMNILLQKSLSIVIQCAKFIKEREKAGLILKWSFTVLVGTALLVFMVNTVFHLLPPDVQTKEKQEIEIQISRPFTIQVSAYLKKKHADTYVAELKGKGLAAYITKADGGGKTWFLVRIASFPDKASAAEYGQNLKITGVIDDFFVDNRDL